ncbi:hypothetical protein T05_12450 [Trichinella murrelli]|uniref:Uncharacterized protein n=1 Tax=Trichinella murrelli TaxID=144512 RepID=A0A0V0TRT7_9BILA|nr:hypothetical protein T05_12450 [Trichinella murrelli]
MSTGNKHGSSTSVVRLLFGSGVLLVTCVCFFLLPLTQLKRSSIAIKRFGTFRSIPCSLSSVVHSHKQAGRQAELAQLPASLGIFDFFPQRISTFNWRADK